MLDLYTRDICLKFNRAVNELQHKIGTTRWVSFRSIWSSKIVVYQQAILNLWGFILNSIRENVLLQSYLTLDTWVCNKISRNNYLIKMNRSLQFRSRTIMSNTEFVAKITLPYLTSYDSLFSLSHMSIIWSSISVVY